MDVTIKPATYEDIDFIAWVLLTSHRGHLERGMWDLMVGGEEQQCLDFLKLLTSTETIHWAHHSIFLVAEVDGTSAAALCGYVDPDLGNETLSKGFSEVKKILGLSDDEVKGRFQRYSSILHVAPEHEEGTWVVENVATRPEFRRKGLVDRLLKDIFEKGRRKGAEIVDISVIIGNDAAQAAYEKNGFKVIDEKRHPEFEKVYGSPGIRTLRRRH